MALTAAQIVTLALQVAKCPGYTSQGGQMLNLVLDDLVLNHDLKINRVVQNIVAAAGSNGPFNLESDYLRTYDLTYSVNGEVYDIFPAGLKEYDLEFKSSGVANYPYEFATDLSPQATQSPGLLYIYPQSSSQLTLQHRYMIKRADIATPETSTTVPWFQDHDYLVHATATRLMKITDDSRYANFKAEEKAMLLSHLLMEGDEQSVVKNIKLDPRTFKLNRALAPTKITD